MMTNQEKFDLHIFNTYTYTRKSDGKVFRCTRNAHWSDIRSEDGETDSVKWYGNDSSGELYVSDNKGHDYVKQTISPLSRTQTNRTD